MTDSTVTGLSCSTALICGIDLGDRSSDLCVLDNETGDVLEEGRLATTPKAFARRFSHTPPSIVAIEAGTHSRWVSKTLEAHGHRVLVAHPQKVRLITDNDTKNDKLDAKRLALLARADPRLLHPIQHRSPEAQADLAVIKARDELVQTRTRLVNHVRGTAKSFGVRLPKCKANVFYREAAAHLPSELSPALAPLLEQLRSLEGTIKHYDALVKQRAREDHPETALLQQVAGVGPLTALAFVLTLEDPYRFPNRRAVGSYLGLRPRQRATGGPDGPNPRLRITKAGNGYLRRLLVGSAQYVLGPFGPDCDLRRWGERLTRRRGKKKAVVAVARKLGVLLHRLWLTGEVYQPFRTRPSHEEEPA